MSQNPSEWVGDPNQSGAFVTLGSQDARRVNYVNALYTQYANDPTRPSAVIVESNWGVRRFIDALPEARLKDVFLIDLSDRTLVVPGNPLAKIMGSVDDRVNVLTRTVRSLWEGDWQPGYEEAYRCALGAMAAANDRRSPESQLGLVSLAFMLRASPDWIENFLTRNVSQREHPWISQYFVHRYSKMSAVDRLDLVEPVIEKSGIFGYETALPMMSAPVPSFSIKNLLDDGKLVIVQTDSGLMNEVDRFFVNWTLSQVQLYLASRTSKKFFLLAVDGIENFSGYEWEPLLAHATKPGVRVVLSPVNDDNMSIGFGRRICSSVRSNIVFSPDNVKTNWIRSLFSNMLFNILPDAVVADFEGDQTPFALQIPLTPAEIPGSAVRRRSIYDARAEYSRSTVDIQGAAMMVQQAFVGENTRATSGQQARKSFLSIFRG